jgi:hypothetical protein
MNYCTCERPTIEQVTDAEQHGGDIREVVIGYVCADCGLEINISKLDPITFNNSLEDYDSFNNR